MNEQESFYEETHGPKVGFVYPVDGPPDTFPGVDNPEIMGQTLDILELESARLAMKLMENMAAWSRTPAAAKLRMLVVQHVVFGEPSVDDIAFRMKVSPRRVFQVAKEVRGHCKPLLKLHHGQPAVRYATISYFLELANVFDPQSFTH